MSERYVYKDPAEVFSAGLPELKESFAEFLAISEVSAAEKEKIEEIINSFFERISRDLYARQPIYDIGRSLVARFMNQLKITEATDRKSAEYYLFIALREAIWQQIYKAYQWKWPPTMYGEQ